MWMAPDRCKGACADLPGACSPAEEQAQEEAPPPGGAGASPPNTNASFWFDPSSHLTGRHPGQAPTLLTSTAKKETVNPTYEEHFKFEVSFLSIIALVLRRISL
jgi:hypothetical protein